MIISIVYIRYTPRIYTVNKLEVCVYIFFSFDLGMWLAWLISVITHVSWFFFSRTLSLRFIYPEISLMAYKIYKCRRITHQNGFLTGEFKLRVHLFTVDVGATMVPSIKEHAHYGVLVLPVKFHTCLFCSHCVNKCNNCAHLLNLSDNKISVKFHSLWWFMVWKHITHVSLLS